ncbi:FtsB family cell division protein [Streptococcus caprae]|uniref:Septum formation initiator family protein n=1 Tax=Streptococcus caprae TaxID=1640501 RepID=A0ABV8CVH6_9STRE
MANKKSSVVQLNNQYITDETTKKRFEEEESRKRNRFIGWVMVFILILFVLPAYNLVASYIELQEMRQQVITLKQDQKELIIKTDAQKLLAERLKNTEYVEKYARAKYYYSYDGENVYLSPELLP